MGATSKRADSPRVSAETLPLEPQLTRGFLWVLFGLVVPVFAVTPLSWLFCLRHLYRHRQLGAGFGRGFFYRLFLYHGYAEMGAWARRSSRS